MICYKDGTLVLTDEEKQVIRQLEAPSKMGGKYLYLVKPYDSDPIYYSMYSNEKNPKDRKFIANIYGNIVVCLNCILKDEIKSGQVIFDVDEILEKYCK